MLKIGVEFGIGIDIGIGNELGLGLGSDYD